MRFIYIFILFNILTANIANAYGILKVKSDVKGAYIFIDNEKRAMTGDGYTIIKLNHGEHKVILKKEIDGEAYEGSDSVFIGEDTELEIFIALTNKKKNKTLNEIAGKYICILDKERGFTMNIHKKKMLIRMYNPVLDKAKDLSSTFDLVNNKVVTMLGGRKVSFSLEDNLVISDEKSFPVICKKDLELSTKNRLTKSSKILGSWREGDHEYNFQENGTLILSKFNKKGEKTKKEQFKWLQSSKNTIMINTKSYPDEYLLVTPFIFKDGKENLSLFNGNLILKRVVK